MRASPLTPYWTVSVRRYWYVPPSITVIVTVRGVPPTGTVFTEKAMPRCVALMEAEAGDTVATSGSLLDSST